MSTETYNPHNLETNKTPRVRPWSIPREVSVDRADSIILLGTGKLCSKCRQRKDLVYFNKKAERLDGRASNCKSCTRKADINYSKTFTAKITKKRYRQSAAGRTADMASKKRYPKRHCARSMVYRRVKSGAIIAPTYLLCIYCTRPAKHWHHHLGYDTEHVLDIIPVCIRCHKCLHISPPNASRVFNERITI